MCILYKTRINLYLLNNPPKYISLFVTGKNLPLLKDQKKLKAIEEGTFYTRDLVSEPGNILHPDEYARRIVKLKKFGFEELDINSYE